MEAIQDAIRRLENIPTTIKKGKDVEAAIIQLPSTARLLGLPSASPNTFARLAENLRGRLLPLYRVSLILTLDYAIAVLRFIHYGKLVLTLQVGHSSPTSWETLLMSLFSGLLDFLEENSVNKIRENIAYALYPILCPLYFAPACGPPLSLHGELLSMVYQVLTATVTSHPRNAATLREHHIQRKSLGITISQTKDFLAIESLLDLFGSIIPSLKGGRDKRTAFIKDVFDHVVFKNTGNKICKLLEDISSPDWSVTAEKIVRILAEDDVSFPQPFEASRLLLNESLTDSFSPFYIDNKQFVINIDKDRRIETLSIPHSTIKNILVSRLTDDNVQIVVHLIKSPMLGNQPILLSSEENPTISWDVKKLSLNGLAKALKYRDLNIGKLGNKLSKVKPIELDFHSNKQDSQILTQKRFEQLSQSWALPASPNNERIIVQPETSPLLSNGLGLTARGFNTDEVTLPGPNTLKQPLTSFSTVFVNLNGDPSLVPQTKVKSPKTPDHSCPTTPGPYNGGTIQKTPDEDDAKTLAPKLKRRQLILSDDEFEPFFGDEFKSGSTTPKSTTKALPKQNNFWSVTTHIEPLIVKGKEKAKTSRFQNHEPGISEQGDLKKFRERLTPNVELNVIDVDAQERRTKALKRGHQEAMSPISVRPHKRIKYSRKGRTPLTEALSLSGIDFEEIPKPEPLKKVGLESFTKTRASAMKGKNGRPVPKPKASTKKQIAKLQHIDLEPESATIMYPGNDLPDEVIIATSVKENNDRGETTVRRSARTLNLRFRSKGAQTGTVIESSTPKKPRKAPWEDPDFLEKAKGLSDQIIPTSDPVYSSPIAEVNVAEVTEQSSDIDFFVDNAQLDQLNELDTKDRHGLYAIAKAADVFTPTKEHKNREEPIVSNYLAHQAIVIDLTTDTSPIVQKKANISKPPDICICKTHQAASLPATEEKTFKKEEHLQPAKIAMKTSISLLDKDKTGGQAFLKKIKIEEHSSPKGMSPQPMFKILKIENASPSVRRTASNSKSKIQKNIPAPLAMGDKKEYATVNFSVSPFDSLPPSNKIQIPPIKALEAIDWERQKREPKGYSDVRHVQNFQMRTQVLHKKITPDPIQKILEVIQQINEVIVHRIENRFENIADSLNTGQRAILEATANSLQDMYHESARHFNDMVDLEENYASHRTTITSRTHDYIKSSEQLVQCFKDVALDHSRQTLSKRLPATLFPKLPVIKF